MRNSCMDSILYEDKPTKQIHERETCTLMLPFLSTSHNMELTLQIESIVRIDSRDGIINERKDVRVHSIAIHRLQYTYQRQLYCPTLICRESTS